jgi:bifunctional non-homologous end joining protein LigD
VTRSRSKFPAMMSTVRGSARSCIRKTRFTKAEVIDYYIRVAPFLLPHLKDRPVTLKRYPDGVTGQAYWIKMRQASLPKGRDVSGSATCRRAGHQIHPDPEHGHPRLDRKRCGTRTASFLTSSARYPKPDEYRVRSRSRARADIRHCIEVAFLVKDVIEQLGLKAFPKLSGSKGLSAVCAS